MNFFSFRVLGKRIKAIRFMMKDKSVKWYKKALIVAGIIYRVPAGGYNSAGFRTDRIYR